MTISDSFTVDRREILAPGLELISEHSHRWEFRNHVEAERNTLRIVVFSFPEETQSCLGKIMISDMLTVGLP
ncbi:hypothetical protein HKD37_18G050778 [Glycine soja]